MKNINSQYKDLKEGKMSQANFMRNLRMSLPQYIAPTTSYIDAITILKGKRILSESLPTETTISEVIEALFDGDFDNDPGKLLAAKEAIQASNHSDKSVALGLLDKKLKEAMDAETGGQAAHDDAQWRRERGLEETKKPLKEAKKQKEVPSINHVDYIQLMKGTVYELEKMPAVTDENAAKAKEKAYKALTKDPNAYRHLLIANYKEIEKKDKAQRAEPAKKDNLVNKANEMKTAKKNEQANTKTTLGKQEKASKNPEGVKQLKEALGYWMNKPADAEKYKIKKDEKGRILQATNDEGQTFSKGDAATAVDNGEKIAISSFIEQQGKVKAVYMVRGTAYTIDIDGLEKGTTNEAVKALKATILKEFQAIPKPAPIYAAGHEVVTPDGKRGTIEELTKDNTAYVKFKDGNIQHYQTNVLKPASEVEDMDEVLTAKTGDASHDEASLTRINKIADPTAKASISKAFTSGQAVDI